LGSVVRLDVPAGTSLRGLRTCPKIIGAFDGEHQHAVKVNDIAALDRIIITDNFLPVMGGPQEIHLSGSAQEARKEDVHYRDPEDTLRTIRI
jgi:hypothetical protein